MPLLVTEDGHVEERLVERIRELETENERLRGALVSRIIIEQAKGAISARTGLTPDEAFEMLRALARSQRRKIHDYATEVVANRGVFGPHRPAGWTRYGRSTH